MPLHISPLAIIGLINPGIHSLNELSVFPLSKQGVAVLPHADIGAILHPLVGAKVAHAGRLQTFVIYLQPNRIR